MYTVKSVVAAIVAALPRNLAVRNVLKCTVISAVELL